MAQLRVAVYAEYTDIWHTCYRDSKQSADAIVSHHT